MKSQHTQEEKYKYKHGISMTGKLNLLERLCTKKAPPFKKDDI